MTDLNDFDALIDDVGELSDEYAEGGRQEYEPRVLPGKHTARTVVAEARKTQEGKLYFSADYVLDSGESVRFHRLGTTPFFRGPKGQKGAPNTSGVFDWLRGTGYEGTFSQFMRPQGRPITAKEMIELVQSKVGLPVGVETELSANCKTPNCKAGNDRGEKFKYASKLPKKADGTPDYKPTCPTCQGQLTAFPYVLRVIKVEEVA